jgi:gamma-glutamyltranspeptidase/glutathione hydrolase
MYWPVFSRLLLITTLFLPSSAAVGQNLRDARSQHGMVVSVSPDASIAGAETLTRQGNAVDASITTAFALAVTHPAAGNVGGGGFMLIHPADGSPPVFIDYREKAPLASTLRMFESGGSRKNHRYVGVPGTVRGMWLAHALYGSRPWKELLEPAVDLARDGFEMHAGFATELNSELQRSQNAEFKRVFGHPEGRPWQEGDRLCQPDLAATLQRIADEGAAGFYSGRTADLLVQEMAAQDGLITHEDLQRYQARIRTPIQFRYRDYDVFSAPPPSSGGITLAQMLGIVEQFNLRDSGRWSTRTSHLMIEAMRRAYANRAQYLGDPDFTPIPEYLTDRAFIEHLAATVDPDKATASAELGPRITEPLESAQTTHFSVMDRHGMAVANTYTLEASYGSGVVVTGAGFLLNNEMGDFNRRPGVTDRRGGIGTRPNQIAPEKRMLSSMTPTIVTQHGKPVLVTGSPGGRTIINTVFCVTLNVLEFGMPIREAIDAPRLDHEWFPERVRFMGADDPRYAELVEALQAMGHPIVDTDRQGDANSILVRDGQLIGAADYQFGAAIAPEPGRDQTSSQ